MNQATLDGIAYAVEHMRVAVAEAMAQVHDAAAAPKSRRDRLDAMVAAIQCGHVSREDDLLWDTKDIVAHANEVLDAIDESLAESPDAK